MRNRSTEFGHENNTPFIAMELSNNGKSKPGNIMVTKEGVVKVVDFGIARLTDMSLTQPNMMIGSRAYMSPQL